VRRNTSADARFWTLLAAPMLTLHASRAAVSFVPSADPEALRYRLHQQRIDFVFHEPLRAVFDPLAVGSGPRAAWDAFPVQARRHREAFRLVHAEAGESVQIFQILPDAAFDQAYELTSEARRDFEASSWDVGREKLERALRLYPGLTDAVNAYAAACLMTGKDRDRARKRLREALRLRPDFAEARANLQRLEAEAPQR
jgi:tetratricopeptide (TPR) repeat protein